MKKNLLSVVLSILVYGAYAQVDVTSYGTSSGTQGQYNSNFGKSAGASLGIDTRHNTFVGAYAGQATYGNFSEGRNVAVGSHALYSNTTGYGNTALGHEALYSNTTGWSSIAIGRRALYTSTGARNIAIGNGSLELNTTGTDNIGIGLSTLAANTSGVQNIAIGYMALLSTVSTSNNIAIGQSALRNNIGFNNVGIGQGALWNANDAGANNNTAIGTNAGGSNVSGFALTAAGVSALSGNTTGVGNTGFGYVALQQNATGNFNTAVGYSAGPDTGLTGLFNTTAVGYNARTTASNQVRIGNSSVTSIGGIVSWTTLSDGRFKSDVKEDIAGLDFIKQLRPVSYTLDRGAVNKFLHGDDEATIMNSRQTGFIAQEVQAVVEANKYAFSGVEVPVRDGDLYSIRYAEFVVPLVKAVQELSSKVEDQQRKIDALLTLLTPEQVAKLNRAVLHQNSPNPFSADTQIRMTLPDNTMHARVVIYDAGGKEVRNFAVQGTGDRTITIGGNELAQGIYLYTLIVNGEVIDTKRMLLTR